MRVTIVVGTVLVAAFFLGMALVAAYDAGRRATRRHHIAQLGLTEGAAKRYATAAKIMERLDGRSDIHGVLAGDLLSADTQRLVGDWVTAHRKEYTTA
jgi:hypothetical protein